MNILQAHRCLEQKFKRASYHRGVPVREHSERHTTFDDVIALTSNKQDVITFLMQKNVIHKYYLCPKCHNHMNIVLTKCNHSSSDGYKWSCCKMIDGKRHEVERTLRKGSWMYNCNLTLEEIVKSIYYWTRELQQKQVDLDLKFI